MTTAKRIFQAFNKPLALLALSAFLAPVPAISEPAALEKPAPASQSTVAANLGSAPAAMPPATAATAAALPTANDATGDSKLTTTAKPASVDAKQKRGWLSAWLDRRFADHDADSKETNEQLVKDADNYNKNRQFIEDCPIDEFIFPAGGGR